MNYIINICNHNHSKVKMYKNVMANRSAGVYTKVLEATECIGETEYSLTIEGCKCSFSFDITEMVSSYGCFSLASIVLSIVMGKSTVS